MSKPDLTRMSDSRLVEYHLFTVRSANDSNVSRNAAMAYRREAIRVERELDNRIAPQS